MRLPMSSITYRKLQTQSVATVDHNMSSSNPYSLELPYLGAIFLGKSPLNLAHFQKPLRELYIAYDHGRSHDQRRILVSDSDILIFEAEKTIRRKGVFIYSKLESIVNIQILKFSLMRTDSGKQKAQVAFLPLGCEHQERFRSLYSPVSKSQHKLLSKRTSPHPSLLLFVLRKSGVTGQCSLLGCHVFAVHRESSAFEFCDMIRKLIIKRTMSPVLSRKQTLVQAQNFRPVEKSQKSPGRDRSQSVKESHPTDSLTTTSKQNNDLISNVNLLVVHRSTTNTSRNPSSSSSLLTNNVQHSSCSSSSSTSLFHNTSRVLTMDSDIRRMSSPYSPSRQRHFTKASSLIADESDEIVSELMNIVAKEESKSQASVKRHASFDQPSSSNDWTMNKKRYLHNRKRYLNPIPTTHHNSPSEKVPPMVESHLLRPQIVLNRYGDIGNYVPKFLRENTTMRSSDSNENIFFRSSNGQLINGFLKLDFLAAKSVHGNQHNHHQSSPCLKQDENIYSLVQQLQKNQTKSFTNIHQNDPSVANHHRDEDHHVLKSIEDMTNGNKIHLFHQRQAVKLGHTPSTSKTKRATALPHPENDLPVDYRQFLRQTDQGVHLYGEEQRHQATLEHSLGYLP